MEGVLRTGTGEIRFFWKLAVTLILIFALIVISRLSLILVVQLFFLLQGTPSAAAFQNAQIFAAESAVGQAIASSLDLLLILLLVILMITRIEKHDFHWDIIGLNPKRNTLPFVIIGLAIGGAIFFGAIIFGALLHIQVLSIIPDFSQWPILSTLVATLIFYILNSFWQEIVFRGYLQTWAVEEYGRLFGILAITLVFVIFHGLVQTLTLIGTISGLLIFGFIGLLYEKTRSLYLVGVIHTALNFLPVLFNISWQGLETVIIYGIALVLLVLLIHQTEQPDSTSSL
ncbi:MAG: lysostaphin resistance A-like protein [Promethearchaeota archaeon]